MVDSFSVFDISFVFFHKQLTVDQAVLLLMTGFVAFLSAHADDRAVVDIQLDAGHIGRRTDRALLFRRDDDLIQNAFAGEPQIAVQQTGIAVAEEAAGKVLLSDPAAPGALEGRDLDLLAGGRGALLILVAVADRDEDADVRSVKAAAEISVPRGVRLDIDGLAAADAGDALFVLADGCRAREVAEADKKRNDCADEGDGSLNVFHGYDLLFFSVCFVASTFYNRRFRFL